MLETSDVSSTQRYYVYILRSVKDGGLYIGFSTNLKKRLSNMQMTMSPQHDYEPSSNYFITNTSLRILHYEYFITNTSYIGEMQKLEKNFLRVDMGEIK